jgi:hypothetical protein
MMANISEGVVCDGCGLGFTPSEYDDRITPHNLDCPNFNYEEDDDGCSEFVTCTCDRNFHFDCYDEEKDLEGFYL